MCGLEAVDECSGREAALVRGVAIGLPEVDQVDCGPWHQHHQSCAEGDDRQRCDVSAEPENEQVTGFAVAIFGLHVADGVYFNERGTGCCCGNHDGRQGNFEYVDVLR